jgi:hypothetical protein
MKNIERVDPMKTNIFIATRKEKAFDAESEKEVIRFKMSLFKLLNKTEDHVSAEPIDDFYFVYYSITPKLLSKILRSLAYKIDKRYRRKKI